MKFDKSKWDATLWVGRQFRCKKTGITLTIPEDVGPKDYFGFGEWCFVDVGDGYYARFGGDIEEIK